MGPVSGPAIWVNIQTEKDFDQYKGKLAGKIVFLGEMREVPVPDKPFFHALHGQRAGRYGERRRHRRSRGPNSPEYQARMKAYMQRMALADKIPQFLADEKALAVIRPGAR
jgi:carboxypeptidase Q